MQTEDITFKIIGRDAKKLNEFQKLHDGCLESTLEVHKTDSSLNSFTLNYFFNISHIIVSHHYLTLKTYKNALKPLKTIKIH